MKTLYKIAIALGVTEWIYFIIAMINGVNLTSVIYITLLAISGFSCYYIQYKRDSQSTRTKSEEQDD